MTLNFRVDTVENADGTWGATLRAILPEQMRPEGANDDKEPTIEIYARSDTETDAVQSVLVEFMSGMHEDDEEGCADCDGCNCK